MSDGPSYDPDGPPLEALDMSDPAVIDAYLDHPNTVAVHDDLARAFRVEPAAVQRAEIERYLVGLVDRREEAERARDAAPAEHREALSGLVDALNGHIASAQARLAELGED